MSYPKMTPNTRLVLSLLVIVAILIPILLAYVLIFPLGISPTRTTATSSSSATSSPSVPTATVTIPNGIGVTLTLNFQPASLSVASGTTITWVDQDTSTHNIAFTSVPSGATMPAVSPDLKQGSTFQVVLTTSGTYTYVCQYHSGWMKGTITVTG